MGSAEYADGDCNRESCLGFGDLWRIWKGAVKASMDMELFLVIPQNYTLGLQTCGKEEIFATSTRVLCGTIRSWHTRTAWARESAINPARRIM